MESACHVGNLGSIPGLGRRKWQKLQYSCLENSMDKGAWQAIVHRVTELETLTFFIRTSTGAKTNPLRAKLLLNLECARLYPVFLLRTCLPS